MQPRTGTIVRFETHTSIDRSIDDVFARLADLDGYGAWMHHSGLFGSCRKTSDGPVREGTRYVDRSRMGTFDGEVSAHQAPTRLSFVETLTIFGRELMQARPAYALEADGNRTIVHHVAEGELYGWMRAMKPMAGMMAGWERGRTVASLKRSLEAERA
jgi:uncharacterized protein YndB with AHSA1/START domain